MSCLQERLLTFLAARAHQPDRSSNHAMLFVRILQVREYQLRLVFSWAMSFMLDEEQMAAASLASW